VDPAIPVARGFQPRGRGPERAALQETKIAGGLREPALEVDPLDLAPLMVDALAPDSIQLEPLDTIAPITVAPIDLADVQRRNE
jgi:hypothetical protein